MITLKERNEAIKAIRADRRKAAARTGVACNACKQELLRMLPGDADSFWKGPASTMGETVRVYCTNPECRFQGLMEEI